MIENVERTEIQGQGLGRSLPPPLQRGQPLVRLGLRGAARELRLPDLQGTLVPGRGRVEVAVGDGDVTEAQRRIPADDAAGRDALGDLQRARRDLLRRRRPAHLQ